jgi:hypothetical protein
MKAYVPSFQFDSSKFSTLFNEIYGYANEAKAIKISGVSFYDTFMGETVDIVVTMSKDVHKCYFQLHKNPYFAGQDVTTMLPVSRADIETVFWRAINAVLRNLDIPETEVQTNPVCQKDITIKLYDKIVTVIK